MLYSQCVYPGADALFQSRKTLFELSRKARPFCSTRPSNGFPMISWNPTRRDLPARLYPRGQLDIRGRDLLYAALVGCFSGATPRRVWPTTTPHLPMLSVRTAWDALLAVKAWPQGSEVIFSEANIPDMVRIIEEHGLVPVPASIDPRTLQVDAREVAFLVTPRTRAILISPLFGSRARLAELQPIARSHDLLLVEDNAQAFRDSNDIGSLEADVSLFSFGLIKTRTALGGAVVFARDFQLLGALEEHARNYPRVSTVQFFRRLARAVLLHALSNPLLFSLFWRALRSRGVDPDVWLGQAARGLSGGNFLQTIRHRPHRATLKLMHRRLHTDSRDLDARRWRGEQARRVLHNLLGSQAEDSVFWASPACVCDREQLISQARRAGFDLSYRSSSLVSHASTLTPFARALNSAVFLPIGTPMPAKQWQRLLQLVAQFEVQSLD